MSAIHTRLEPFKKNVNAIDLQFQYCITTFSALFWICRAPISKWTTRTRERRLSLDTSAVSLNNTDMRSKCGFAHTHTHAALDHRIVAPIIAWNGLDVRVCTFEYVGRCTSALRHEQRVQVVDAVCVVACRAVWIRVPVCPVTQQCSRCCRICT